MNTLFKKSFLKKMAKKEKVTPEFLEAGLKQGTIVIPQNKNKELESPAAIGEGLKVKLNTNLGTSSEQAELKEEKKKLATAVKYGTDAIMDLSTGPQLKKVLKEIIKASPVPVGTVPIYQAALDAEKKYGEFEKMTKDDLMQALIFQAEAGVDFFTIHAGIRKYFLDILDKQRRTAGIVSRGGAILARWMFVHKQENPLYEYFDEVLDIARKYNITISLGDALRPGALADSTDRLQMKELEVLSGLVRRCWEKKVQVMVEGPGHIKIDEIEFNMQIEKKLCRKAPFYILGPLTTDIFFGYDHIVSAIGGAIAARAGANFLCVVTPAEHLRQPSAEDIKMGVIASRIAAHSVDLLKFKDELEKDKKLSLARAKRDWNEVFTYSIDREKAEEYRAAKKISTEDVCSMCGKLCSLKLIDKCDLLK